MEQLLCLSIMRKINVVYKAKLLVKTNNYNWDIIVWSELPRILHFFLKLYFAFFSAPSSFWILGRAYSYRENYALSRSKKN